MKKIYLSISLLISIGIFSQQVMGGIEIKSPQSYAFEKYGNVPVNLYTGTLDLKVPIYSLPTDGGKNIEVFLSYDSSGFLPHKKSDYAGTGWSLLAGGRITRKLNKIPDEYIGSPASAGSSPFDSGLNLHGFLTGVRLNSYTNNEQVYDLNSGVGGITGSSWRLGSVQNGYEGEPDIFNFNALGLSGKFIVGNDGNVLVESNDPNAKVDITGLVSYGGKEFCKPPNQTIIITDGQGNKYYFGGDFSKYEISYNVPLPGVSKDNWFKGVPYISSFSLSKVEFTNKQTITFNYVQDTLNNTFCSLALSSSNSNIISNAKVMNFEGYFQDGASVDSWIQCPGGLSGCSSSSSGSQSGKENFVLTKRSLLESIKYEDSEIKISYKDAGYPIKHYEGTAYSTLNLNEFLVDKIQVFNKTNLIQNTVFNYDNFGGLGQRPFLKNVIEQQSNKIYSFEYYNTSTLPKYVTKGLDHWGYWNGNDGNTSLAPFDTYNAITGDYTLNNTFRDTNAQKYNVGLLSKIIYPTKGYSVFEFEPNYYSKRIERNSASSFLPVLTNNTGIVGGSRIYRQYDYSENGGIINDKIYKYTTSLDGTVSSGILMNWPRYLYYIEFSAPGFLQKLMLRSSSNVQQNSLDSYNVGYQKVYEVNAGKGYVEYNFTNYEDYPDILNPDVSNLKNYSNSSTQASPENLYKNLKNLYGIDRSILRGKLKSEIIYPEGSSSPLKKTEYIYNDNIDYNPNNLRDNNNYVTVNHLSGYWVQGYKKYLNTSAIKKKIVTDYLNNNPVTNTTEYFYNSSNHLNLTKENNILTDNSEFSKNYFYAQDPNVNNNVMISKNMIGIPVINEVKKNNKVVTKTETIYPTSTPTPQAGNLVLPLSVKSYDVLNGGESREVTYDKYDQKGNILQYTTKEDVPVAILWGYNQTQPIAKIEGITYDQLLATNSVAAIVSKSDEDAADPTKEGLLLDALNDFRKQSAFAGKQVSTFTYDPLIGVTSITPPTGIREVYVYDTANRLKEVKVREKDAAGNYVFKKVKEYNYNYKQ